MQRKHKKQKAMKTRNFTLIAIILMMGAVMTAAGQPARGERNGNHENNNRSEIKSAARDNVRRETASPQRQGGNIENRNSAGDRRSYSESGQSNHNQGAVTENKELKTNHNSINENRHNINGTRDERENRGYADNRSYRENPAPNNRDNNRKLWDNRNYSRHEWEHRNYNWNDRDWNFSNYYRNGYIPYYFRNNANYWYYPEYGHILRGFMHEPFLFYSGQSPFYFEDGFFYRHYNGIGYVWVENPYDIWFNELPYQAVRVRIGGKIFFRLGNAYFEHRLFGFRLVIVPDRYYDPNFDRRASIEISARF
jgi:hypothetical protein